MVGQLVVAVRFGGVAVGQGHPMLVELIYQLIQPAFEAVAGVAEGLLHGDRL